MPAQKVVAVIPARGGSVSIPKKNIKPLLGRPLIDWVIRAALDSGVFSEIYVSTDDNEIAAIAIECGAKVHRRGAETATATASTESAIADFIAAHPAFDVLCLIQATSPLIKPADFIEGLDTMKKNKADSLVTAVRTHRFLWAVDVKSGEARAKNYEPLRRPRRQDWHGELIENGAFYYFTRSTWDAHGCRLGGKVALYEMEEHTLTELDSLVDWAIVSHMAADYGYHGPDAGAGAGAGAGASVRLSVTASPAMILTAAVGCAVGAAITFLARRR